MRIIAVIPAFQEADRLAKAVASIRPFVTDVVVVVDGSKDGTLSVARQTGAHVLYHAVNRGQGAALQTGTEYALTVLQAEAIVHFDADGQMAGEEVRVLLEPILRNEADIVLGSRFLGKEASAMPRVRKVLVRIATLGTMILSGIRVTDTHNGFRVLTRKAAKEIEITIDRMAHASEILDLIKAKQLRYMERPVTITYSEESLTKGQSTFRAVASVKDILTKKLFGE